LEVLEVTNGGFVAADFTAQNVIDNAAGTIDYAVAQMNRPAAQGSGTLLNIVFRAKANGSSTVALRSTQAVPSGLLLSDLNGLAIQASWANGTVNVGGGASSATYTPTPVTPVTASPTPVTPATFTPTPGTSTTFTPTPTPIASATFTPVPATPTPVSPIYVPPQAAGILGTHTVRWGETLYCIGRAYKVTPWAIAEVNHLWWPNLIFPYQSLLIPNVPWLSIPAGPVCQAQFTTTVSTPTPPIPTVVPTVITSIPPTAVVATATATAVPVSTSCRYYYVVRPGDNLFRIALSYGTNYNELARINNIADPRLIYVGQQICIP
jgi:LysM repeat protein